MSKVGKPRWSSHTLLIDAGWASDGKGFAPGDPRKARDANRIVAAARDAGVSRIDYLLVTHFHTDHIGGVSELARLMPIRGFVDHGAPHAHASATSEETKNAFAVYAELRGKSARHIDALAGDRLPLTDIEVTVVSSGGDTISAPLPGAGAANATCPAHVIPPKDPDENARSTGVLVRHGNFRFLDVGDLTGQPLLDLVCPRHSIGQVDAFLTAHHGGADAGGARDIRRTPAARRHDEQLPAKRRRAPDVRGPASGCGSRKYLAAGVTARLKAAAAYRRAPAP